MLFLLLVFILGTKQILVGSFQTEEIHSLNIEESVAKLNTMFTKFIKDDMNPEENVLFSPLNIYAAFALLHLGANGETRQELSNALGIPADDNGFTAHRDLGKILNDLQTTDSAEVNIANKIFLQKGLRLKNSYLQVSKYFYNNEAQLVNFAKRDSEATNIVNDWVSRSTKNHIPKLFDEIPRNTVLLAASALFFKASWHTLFPKNETTLKKFSTGVRDVMVKMMHSSANVRIPYMYFERLEIKAISIPYINREFSMAVILPIGTNSVTAFIGNLTAEDQLQLIRVFRSTRGDPVEYEIPRFKFGWKKNIDDLVVKSGMKKLFEGAEFGNFLENSANLPLSEIIHATEIQVDESGTEAAAVTTTTVPKSGSTGPIKFHVNRPFLIWIYHEKTGVVLFTGIVQNPPVD